jgi:hypothetical protein
MVIMNHHTRMREIEARNKMQASGKVDIDMSKGFIR